MLSSAKEYVFKWKQYLNPTNKSANRQNSAGNYKPVPVPSHEKINGQRFSRLQPRFPLREAKLKRLDAMCEDEFNSNGQGQGVARAAEPDTFGIRFRNVDLPPMARRGNSTKGTSRKPFKTRNPAADPNYGWDEESWSEQYYLERDFN